MRRENEPSRSRKCAWRGSSQSFSRCETKPGHEHEVDRAATGDLVGDVEATTLRVPDRRALWRAPVGSRRQRRRGLANRGHARWVPGARLGELAQKRCGRLQVRRVEPLGEALVGPGQQAARLAVSPTLAPATSERGRRPKLERPRLLAAGNGQRLRQALLRLEGGVAAGEERHSAQASQLCFVGHRPLALRDLEPLGRCGERRRRVSSAEVRVREHAQVVRIVEMRSCRPRGAEAALELVDPLVGVGECRDRPAAQDSAHRNAIRVAAFRSELDRGVGPLSVASGSRRHWWSKARCACAGARL